MGCSLRLAVAYHSGIDPPRTSLPELVKAFFDDIQRARANTDIHRKDGAGLALGGIEVGILQSHLRRCKGQLRVSRHPVGFPISRHVVQRVKVFDLSGNAIPEPGRVEECDRPDAALTRRERAPELFQTGPIWGEDAHARNDRSSTLVHLPVFFIICAP